MRGTPRYAVGLVLLLMACLALPRSAAAETRAGWFDLPVPGGLTTLASLGIDADERAFTLPVLARVIYDRESRLGAARMKMAQAIAGTTVFRTVSDATITTIPAPLDADTWWQLLPPPKGDLFGRLLTDRSALLLAVALMSADDSVRALVARDRELLRFIYRDAAGPFLIAARHVHLVNDRLELPGGAGADEVWQALTGEQPSRPGAFLRALLSKDQGRLAWYFDTIGGLDASRLRATWPPGPTRIAEATALYASFRDSDPQWRTLEQPFRRGVVDAWTVVSLVDIRDGAVVSALPPGAWEGMFSSDRLTDDQSTRILEAAEAAPVSMAWLARQVLAAPARERRDRFEMFRLAQRVFARTPVEDRAQLMVALTAIRDYRALLLALERIGVEKAATWARVIAAARHVSTDASSQREALTSFQAALALVERLRHVRSINVADATALLHSLSDSVTANRHVVTSVSKWITGALIPSLPRLIRPDAFTGTSAYESTLLQALAGPVADPGSEAKATGSRTLAWEGLNYTVDVVAAEHERLRRMRALLVSPGLDAVLESGRGADVAAALSVLVYATALGDPEGPASLSPDIAARHDLGLRAATHLRDVLPWAPAEERQGVGVWRVQGSLLGLDLGLARLVLRRIASQEMPSAPTLTLNDLATLTRTAAAMVVAELGDGDRDAVAAAVERGRRRVANASSLATQKALADEAGLSHTSRQLLPWLAAHQPDAVGNLFSLRHLMWLGKPDLTTAQLDRWGVVGTGLDGRQGTVMPQRQPWEDYAGRSEAGQVTTQLPDVTLRLVEETSRLRLPAQLIPSLLAFALGDYWHEAHVRFADDWPRLARQAAALTPGRVEDYVAALTGHGPLRTQ